MLYSECGWKAEVEVLSAECDERGLKITMRITETLLRPIGIDPEAIPKDGEIFVAWKSKDATSSAGWNISD